MPDRQLNAAAQRSSEQTRQGTVGPAVQALPTGAQGGHHLYVRTPTLGGIGGPTSAHVELEASVCGFGLRSALTPAAARVLALNLMAGAERVEALTNRQAEVQPCAA